MSHGLFHHLSLLAHRYLSTSLQGFNAPFNHLQRLISPFPAGRGFPIQESEQRRSYQEMLNQVEGIEGGWNEPGESGGHHAEIFGGQDDAGEGIDLEIRWWSAFFREGR